MHDDPTLYEFNAGFNILRLLIALRPNLLEVVQVLGTQVRSLGPTYQEFIANVLRNLLKFLPILQHGPMDILYLVNDFLIALP